jgi:hypothetical protein
MTTSADFTPFDPDALPPVVARYLVAHADRRTRATAAEAFAVDARVVDEGIEYLGREAIEGWLTHAASEYTYTTSFIGQRAVDAERWVVLVRLEGDFPGGVADLRFRFTVRGDGILDLVIAP